MRNYYYYLDKCDNLKVRNSDSLCGIFKLKKTHFYNENQQHHGTFFCTYIYAIKNCTCELSSTKVLKVQRHFLSSHVKCLLFPISIFDHFFLSS